MVPSLPHSRLRCNALGQAATTGYGEILRPETYREDTDERRDEILRRDVLRRYRRETRRDITGRCLEKIQERDATRYYGEVS